MQQQPLQTGYTARTTTKDVIKGIDLTGKTAIVTGGAAGLGLETTTSLAEAGATVIVPVRNPQKAAGSLASLPNIVLYETEMDLSKRETIERFVKWFQNHYTALHLLINCAGIMAIPLQRDPLGNELQLSVNYLGHYHLTKSLLPQLRAARGARIVNLSSRGHWRSPFHFEAPNFLHTEYDKWKAYGQSKTAVSLMSVALDQLYRNELIRSFAIHPGSIVTNLSVNLSKEEMAAMGALTSAGERGYDSYDEERKTIPEGAATIVWCATSPQLDKYGGVYCENCDISPIAVDDQVRKGVKPWAVDHQLALQLWQQTEELFQ
ncbi:SDR family NAD(P)-dependent oxidoreductase [Alkalihalobacillus oceani]|uniref:SDR family NAD(P)-dependent oxidoreductase n=1 Tax=Halalkalibacter oceani TaxID=1653776 RepID=A0A9X2DT32_9BACI|nr:SDR family NAD(P)-dependent oxidoreductase [Halalkalibacter oceani]MCM3714957.1 SDR family NAD(P)-dependent oxidoreductase [Halalkalibacter oceani]